MMRKLIHGSLQSPIQSSMVLDTLLLFPIESLKFLFRDFGLWLLQVLIYVIALAQRIPFLYRPAGWLFSVAPWP